MQRILMYLLFRLRQFPLFSCFIAFCHHYCSFSSVFFSAMTITNFLTLGFSKSHPWSFAFLFASSSGYKSCSLSVLNFQSGFVCLWDYSCLYASRCFVTYSFIFIIFLYFLAIILLYHVSKYIFHSYAFLDLLM